MAGIRDQVEEMDIVDEAIPHKLSGYMAAMAIKKEHPSPTISLRSREEDSMLPCQTNII